MSQEISWDLKVPLINKLMIQMMWSRYNLKDRKIVAKRIVAKCDNNLTNLHREGRQLYRIKQDRKTDIKPDKSTWFRKAGATTTLQVPNTHNSQLAKTLRGVIKKYPGPKGTNVKVRNGFQSTNYNIFVQVTRRRRQEYFRVRIWQNMIRTGLLIRMAAVSSSTTTFRAGFHI